MAPVALPAMNEPQEQWSRRLLSQTWRSKVTGECQGLGTPKSVGQLTIITSCSCSCSPLLLSHLLKQGWWFRQKVHVGGGIHE
eukprot:scaffold39972_cov19-Tisochrysis_lutea.AAC.4